MYVERSQETCLFLVILICGTQIFIIMKQREPYDSLSFVIDFETAVMAVFLFDKSKNKSHRRIRMKKKLVSKLALLLGFALVFSACGNKAEDNAAPAEETVETVEEVDDQVAADNVAALIDAIYVQERTDKTDEQCAC